MNKTEEGGGVGGNLYCFLFCPFFIWTYLLNIPLM